jgi:hypothetical protein
MKPQWSVAVRVAAITFDLWPDANDLIRRAAAGLLDQALGTAADGLRTDATKTASD